MESKKQEAIRLAYGEYFEEMKPFINEDGWFDKNSFYNKVFSFNYEQVDVLFTHKEDFMIPTKHKIPNRLNAYRDFHFIVASTKNQIKHIIYIPL